MYFERYGSGENIFLGLHGWGGDRTVFAPLAEFVPDDVTFYSADLPGISLSPGPSEWTIEAIVNEILEMVSAIGKPRVTIIGHCGGAIFGLLSAAKAQSLIERMVMIDPFVYLPRYFKIFLNPQIGEIAYKTTFANPLGRWVTNQALRGRRPGKANLTESFNSINHETARNYLALFAEMEKLKIPEISGVKIDLVLGKKTFRAVRKSVALLKERLPQSRIWTLEKAAHLPVQEATGELSRILFKTENI